MIRNRKILLLAGFAVLALSAVGASSASANFTTEHTAANVYTNISGGNTVLTSEPDGTGATAHHVFDVPNNGSITCNAIDGEATASGPSQLAIRVKGKGATPATGCTFLGQPATVELNGCELEFKAPTTVSVIGCTNASKTATFGAGGCTVHIPEQTLVGHAKFRNLGAGGNDMYVTGEGQATNIISTATGAGCIIAGETKTRTYTTGNTIIKGHEDPTGAQKPITVD